MKKLTLESFKEKATNIHNNLYDYSKVEYKNMRSYITIICSTHGEFIQKAKDHVHQKQGCPKCSHNFPLTIADIQHKSKILYGDKYVINEFSGMKHSMSLTCKLHGEFTLKIAEVHLRNKGKGGCPTCCLEQRLENLKPGNISKVEKQWLDEMNVPFRQHKISICDKTFIVDGFDPNTNTVYECYGSFWHGNPEMYNADDLNTKVGKTFGELYQKTLERENLIKSKYMLVSKWV